MKTNRKTLLVALAAATGVAGIAWGVLWYRGERARIDGIADRYVADLSKRADALAEAADTTRRLQVLAGTTLGRDEESTSAEIRSALNQILAHHGLAKGNVSTRSAVPVRNPAAAARVDELRRQDLRDQPDFLALTATATGEGTLEQALRAFATIQGQRWAHRVDAWSLRPEGKERERVALSVTLTTLILPGVEPRWEGEPPPLWSAVGDFETDLWQSIATRDIFREPPPPPAAPNNGATTVAAQPPPPPPPPPGPPPLSEWRLTGVADTPRGPEILLYNDRTGEARVFAAGGTLQDLTFVRAAGETVRVRVGEQEFEVALGSTLAERKPATP